MQTNSNTAANFQTEAHKTSSYILQDEKGALYITTYRPTENFKHHRTSGADAYSLQCGLFIDEPSHNLWLNDVVNCHFNWLSHQGILSRKFQAKVVAKKSDVWNYALPVGERSTDVKKTSNFDTLLLQYRNQKNK